MKILAIDTSCDETSVAVTSNDNIISNKISSQIEIHKKWGGVVPSIARRMHEENIDFVVKEALAGAKVKLSDIDVFAVTKGPGLSIALEVGIKKIKELAKEYKKPVVAVNHMEGHIYSALSHNKNGNPKIKYSFPFLALLVSGGHTETVLVKEFGKYEILGRTLDDAVGEAYDKVARMLELGYPGGPIIEKLAKLGDETRFPLPVPMTKTRTTDMSYSGLKTAVLYLTQKVFIKDLKPKEKTQIIYDISASFQKSAIDSLLIKTKIALEDISKEYKIKDLILAGGVSANMALRKKFRSVFGKNYRIHFPTDKKLFGDNAGMIGVAAYHNALRGNFTDVDGFERDPNLSL